MVIRLQQVAENGVIEAAQLNRDGTAEAPAYQPIPADDARIQGKLVAVIRPAQACRAGHRSEPPAVCVMTAGMDRSPRRLTITLEPQHAERLARLARCASVPKSTLAGLMLSKALDEADPDAGSITATLDAIGAPTSARWTAWSRPATARPADSMTSDCAVVAPGRLCPGAGGQNLRRRTIEKRLPVTVRWVIRENRRAAAGIVRPAACWQ